MSYCVNCGVELEPGKKSCPLCSVPVINPLEAGAEYTSLYPDVPVEGVKAGLRDLILPVTLLLLIPASITLISDYLTSGRLSWSRFVVCSLLLVWIFLIPPFATRRDRLLLCLAIDWAGLIVYLYALSMATGSSDWLAPLALPLAGVLGVLVLGTAALFIYADTRKLVRFSIITFESAAYIVFTEFTTDRFAYGTALFGWSLLVAVPLAVIGVVALVVNRNQRLREDLKERLFF